MANPFIVQQPAPARIISGSPVNIDWGAKTDRDLQAKREANKQEDFKTAMDSNSPEMMAQFSVKYPEVAQQAQQAFGFANEQSRGLSTMSYGRALQSGTVEGAVNALTKGAEQVAAAGGNPVNMMEDARKLSSGEMDLNQLEMGVSIADPQLWDRVDKFRKSQRPEVAGTATQKDFAQYQALKQSDPEAAKQFGAAAGFIKDGAKRLFQVKKNEDGTTTKYFSDGTEQVVPATASVKTPDMRSSMSQDKAIKIIDKAKEGQLKNAGFALTLNDGLKQVESLTGKGYDPMSASWVNKYLAGTTVGNLLMSDEDQLFVGSVEQMINAIARRETGAAITEFEKKDFFNRYMPVAGDSDKRIAQKKSALERQFKSIRGQSGSVYDAIRVSQGLGPDKSVKATSAVQQQGAAQPVQQQSAQPQVYKSSALNRQISEQDILDTLQANPDVTREQLLKQLGVQ